MESGRYKLLVVDVDGTLVARDESISVAHRQVLAKVCRQGIQVSLSTGRAPCACLRIIRELSLHGYHIFCDGALVMDLVRGEHVCVHPLSYKAVERAIEFARSNNVYIELYSVSHCFVERKTWLTDIHQQVFGIEPTVVDFNKVWNRQRIIKAEIAVSSPQEAMKVSSFCLTAGSVRCSRAGTPVYPGIDFINILAPEVSKGKALTALASHLGVSMDQVIAVGDGLNDVSLLSSAGLAVAMGNAPSELKAVADYVTLDIDHDGLEAAVNKFLPC